MRSDVSIILKRVDKKIPVVEIFGPTIQGEGGLAGVPTVFLRTGGCDYLCKYCDSMHAVDPFKVKASAVPMVVEEIGEALITLCRASKVNLVTISGGNPAMWHLGALVEQLHAHDIDVAVETQGSIQSPWLKMVDYLTVSPKGPSMIEDQAKALNDFRAFLEFLHSTHGYRPQLVVKVPVFSLDDIAFCQSVRVIMNLSRQRSTPLFLSAGNLDVGQKSIAVVRTNCLEKLKEVTEWVLESVETLSPVVVLPQLHVLLWGTKTGV